MYVGDYLNIKIQSLNESGLDVLRECSHCFELFIDSKMEEIDYKNIRKYIDWFPNRISESTFCFKIYGNEVMKDERFENIWDDED